MLSFLRKIRKSLIEPGSAKRYLLYSIGEIALVVLGILIALQINNWNERRITTNKEYDLLRVLSKELTSSHDYLNSRIRDLDKVISSNGMKILEYTKTQRKDVSIDSFSHHLMQVFYIGGFAPPSAKFQQVVGGDGMDLISFDSLQLLLIQYQNQLNLAARHDMQMGDMDDIKAFWNKNLNLHTIVKQGGHGWYDLFENDDSSSFSTDIYDVISNPDFENIIVDRLMLLNSSKKRLDRGQRHIKKLLSFIERHYDL